MVNTRPSVSVSTDSEEMRTKLRLLIVQRCNSKRQVAKVTFVIGAIIERKDAYIYNATEMQAMFEAKPGVRSAEVLEPWKLG
jgi:hypothetical protein